MSKECSLRIYYKEVPTTLITKQKISELKNYEDLIKAILDKSKKLEKKNIEIQKIAIKENEKFVLELEEKINGLDSVYNNETFSFLYNKLVESKPENIKVFIVKVKKYPEWKPPQICKIFENTLKNASKEVINSIKKDLTQEELENGNRVYIKERKEEKELDDDNYRDVHAGVFCNNCHDGNFFGLRYICAECNNFNLCENCYKNDIHSHNKEHTFIRLKDPIDVDITNYSCIFNPSRIFECREYDSFELEVEVINNGMNNLSLCFISPIRFGKNYLGCSKTSITTESCNNGEKFNMKMLLTFEDEPANGEAFKPLDEYEGYFRLMTREGIPFGDILYVKVTIKN